MSEVTVHGKEPHALDEIFISDLSIPYATIYNVGSSKETRIDIHLKIDEARALCNALNEKLENQVVSPSVDR